MTVKEMYQTALELVGLETMPEDSGIIYDAGKEVTKVLAGIDMDTTMLMLAKQGVSLVEMQEVLGTLLSVQPTEEMRQAVTLVHAQTPRWGMMGAALQH